MPDLTAYLQWGQAALWPSPKSHLQSSIPHLILSVNRQRGVRPRLRLVNGLPSKSGSTRMPGIKVASAFDITWIKNESLSSNPSSPVSIVIPTFYWNALILTMIKRPRMPTGFVLSGLAIPQPSADTGGGHWRFHLPSHERETEKSKQNEERAKWLNLVLWNKGGNKMVSSIWDELSSSRRLLRRSARWKSI